MKNSKIVIDMENPIVQLRNIRDEHAKEFNYDIHAIIKDLNKYALDNNIKTVNPNKYGGPKNLDHFWSKLS